ncbi:MAG TPA: flavocytochrome c [Sutterella sp.]|nr:flavocytochrome c [Sutterella sp.]
MRSLRLSGVTAAVALATLSFAASAALYQPGTYTAKVNGHNASMTVAVTVSANKIQKIDYSKNLETIGVGKLALDRVAGKILAKQSLGIDNITGATISSMALKSAVRNCLKQAGATDETLAKLSQKAEHWKALPSTMKTEVVIVGGGGSGLASAVAAMQAGAKVIVLERLGFFGGSTNVSEGALNANDPVRQPRQGIKDSIPHHMEDTLNGGHNTGNVELVRHLVNGAYPAIQWLESLGVQFKDEVGTATGALWQRSHYTKTPSGNSYIRVFEKVLRQHPNQVQLIPDMVVESIIRGEDGRVTGVMAKSNKTGKVTKFEASKGVVVATGGFGANIALRQKVNTGVFKDYDLGPGIGCTNFQKSAQGSGIEMGQKIGANVIGMSDIQVHPCGTPGTGLMEMIRTSGRNRVFINTDGNRFVNEGAPRDVLAKAIFAQKGATYYVLVNHLRYPSLDWVDRNGARVGDMIELGRVVPAQTLEELAKKLNMPYKNLKKSIDDYNAVVSGKAKDPLGFVANNKADKLMTEGPWYACQKVPTVHHTMGGLEINVNAQVLDTKGKVIPGLYAAGETTGGIHGENRLGGNAICDIMVYGRTAGTNAAKGL